MNTSNKRRLFASFIFVGMLGCSKPSGDKASPALPDAAPSAAVSTTQVALIDAGSGAISPSSVTTDVKSRTDPRYAALNPFVKMAVEKTDRPAGALKSDVVFDAIAQKLSLPVTNRRQVLGAIIFAGYCEKGDIEPAVDIVVCEYDDQATLTKGRNLMLSMKAPRREIVDHKLSTISIARLDDAPAAVPVAKRVVDFVKTL